jgi:hypothetical protein
MLGPLIFLQRMLHKELQSVLLLITRSQEIALVIFSLLFLPGVLLHELSHFVAAKLLRVQTGRFSLIPQRIGNGRLRMGYVETAKTDLFRDALIGFAPLLTGGLFVSFAGVFRLGLLNLWEALIDLDMAVMFETIGNMFAQPDFWLWFYLTVAVSSTMMPSSSDRKAWLPIVIAISFLILLGIIFGLGSFLLDAFGIPLNNAFRATAIVFAISSGVQALVLLPTVGVRKLLTKFTGLEVVGA